MNADARSTPMLPHYLDGMNAVERVLFKAARAARCSRAFYGAYCGWHRDRPAIARFAGRHAGQRCFILGGGPSLKLIDPAPLRNEVTFAVNGIFLIYDWLGFEPSYYVVEDFLVYADRWREIREQVRASNCFFPDHFRHAVFDRDNHHYFRAIYDFDPRSGFPRFSRNAARVLWIGGTVTYICLQLALYMGFKEVYLIGMDHNYRRPAHVESVGDVWTSHGEDPNHFHPQYFGAGYRWHDPQVERMETAYQRAREVYAEAGAQVFNATVGGHLEVFPRVDYAQLFSA
ncbi:MAG: DUF115 domain-containing protein [Proteobacteria bacterium]|nr:DUF115 domain-containing protein [Pseudomonadota bacterium]